MKKILLAIIILLPLIFPLSVAAQRVKPETRQNTTCKQYIVRGETATPELDNVTTYDHLGRKIEEIEYASYGQKQRTTYEYDGDSDRCIRRVEYNDKNKVVRIQKIEYNPDGTKAKIYNYSPKGRLKYTKVYEYSASTDARSTSTPKD